MKRYIALMLMLTCLFTAVGCGRKDMNYIIANKSCVTGVVEEVHETHVILRAEEAEGYPNGTVWSVSLQAENKSSYTDLAVGDEITVYHDGNVMDSDPLQVGKVHAIVLITPADRTGNEAS